MVYPTPLVAPLYRKEQCGPALVDETTARSARIAQ